MSEELRGAFNQYEIPAYSKPYNTIQQLLVRPKDKVLKERVVGPVYSIELTFLTQVLISQVLREEGLVMHFTEKGCVSQLKAVYVKYCIQCFEHT